MLSKLPRPLTMLIVSALVVLVGGLIAFYSFLPQTDELNLHVAKLIAQFIILVLFGAAVASYLKYREDSRCDTEAFAIFREDIRKRITEAYQRTKGARSALRAAGMNHQVCDGAVAVSAHAIEAYRSQMEVLNEIQLDLEKVWHEVKTFRHLFTEGDDIVRRLMVMSGFLRKVIDEYEKHWCTLRSISDAPTGVHLEKLSHLVDSSAKGGFREKFCDRFSEVVDLIRADQLRAKT